MKYSQKFNDKLYILTKKNELFSLGNEEKDIVLLKDFG